MNDQPENAQNPLPFSLSVIKSTERHVSKETIVALKKLLSEAESGKLTGLAVAALYKNGQFHLALEGEALQEGNQMGVVGMLTALQKIALDLH